MWIPFEGRLDGVFRGDRSVGWKMAGAGLVSAVAGGTIALNAIEGEASPRLIVTLAGGLGVAGAALGLLLAVKDAVKRRTSRGERVHPLLRLYFGRGTWSLLLWFPTLIAACCGLFLILMVIVAIVEAVRG